MKPAVRGGSEVWPEQTVEKHDEDDECDEDVAAIALGREHANREHGANETIHGEGAVT
jgi:hypothetical protein